MDRRTETVAEGLHRRVTIADVARHAGVSVPTVSKVINGRANVAARTRERVEEVIRTHGYLHPRKLDDDVVHLVFHRLDGQWALDIVKAVQSLAASRGFGVVVSEAEDGHSPSLEWLDDVFSRRSATVICVGAELSRQQRDRLAARSIPLVALDPEKGPVNDIPSVGATNWNGGYAAARHLLELGHRRIAAISGPPSAACARARLDGYRAALDSAQVAPGGRVRSADFLVEGGYRAARELLTEPERATAVFTGNDLQAVGVYRAADELGLRIPQDLSVVGFDDLEVAEWINPRLTTVHQPLKDMARVATEIALDLVAGRTQARNRVELSTHLVVRGSTAPPPA